jgi:hypothetical protein
VALILHVVHGSRDIAALFGRQLACCEKVVACRAPGERRANGKSLLANAKRGEDSVQDIIGRGGAGDRAQRT